MNEIKLCPTVKNLVPGEGRYLFTGAKVEKECCVPKLKAMLSDITRATGVELNFGEGVVCELYENEEYDFTIDITPDSAKVQYTKGNICDAMSVIMQMCIVEDGKLYLPCCHIDDKADLEHRGLMVDLARTWHPFEYLLSYVDLCRYYRASVLHLHFMDSESFTLPLECFPKLPSPDRHYTREQIDYLVQYAHDRQIEIMPEIETPGHSWQFIARYPEIFGTAGILGFEECVFEALDKIIAEICEMFPHSPKIHVGGDEAMIEYWLSVDKYVEYAKSLDLIKGEGRMDAERMYATFLKKMTDIVNKYGRTCVMWEGFAKEVNYICPPSDKLIVISWENFFQLTPSLVKEGYQLINCSWTPMYIVYPNIYWSQEEVYNWNTRRFRPWHPDSPFYRCQLEIPPYEKMLGGQVLAWGDGLQPDKQSLDTERRLIEDHVAAMSQNTRHDFNKLDYATFSDCYKAVSERLLNMIEKE
ncbi:MAG: family 20 glycosylhydrolase [Clostridia bacterium]|nr:family 20 glycosylhydrolase [Clostridia bacterium]